MSINYFDQIFFSKYLNNEEILHICHKHIIKIIDNIILWLFFWVIIPTFFYYNNSFWLQDYISFFYFKIYLVIVYIILIYQIFDWYNDVWIITNKWIIDLDWSLFKTNIVYIEYTDMRWIELQRHSFLDTLIDKWDIAINLEWEDSRFSLEDATSPWIIVWQIQDIIEDIKNHKNDDDESSFDILLWALKNVVKERLKEDGVYSYTENINNNEEIEKVLQKKWTIDLRKNI